ncbi:hypothetical protein HDE_12841 [Halotydeus destructor]|nr:hypothetical protein HDE_12841 [Halotydeus destructor]
MEEEDVFRAVLEWAKNQAGVTQPTVHWSDEERQRVCHNLQGVIEHVRLLLIDSQVFAEEVEPTGAVPMEMSLERYRFAALPSKFQTDRRVQARKTNKLFQNSKLLTGDRTSLQKILNQWLGDPKQTWRLIYRASSHGFTAQSFHHHCDNQGPTMIIIQSANGNVAGGFTDISWDSPPTSRGKYLPSDKCFLFTLINNQDQPPTKFAIKKRSFAVVHHPDFGPVFGAGADLSIASDCNANGDSYSSLPHSYDGLGANSTILFGDDNFTVVDYEVFAMLRK